MPFQFFGRRGANNVLSASDLFTEVCGKKLPEGRMDGVELLSKVEEYERDMELLTHGYAKTTESFDEIFDKIQKEKETSIVGPVKS